MASDRMNGSAAVPGAGMRSLRPPSGDEGRRDLKPDYKRSWAVVIGIDGYQNMRQLRHAVKDADGMARLLIEELGFPKEQVLVVLDPAPLTSNLPYDLVAPQASKAVIEGLLFTEIPKLAEPDDRVIIFFAGHGERRLLPTGEKIGHLVPVEAQPERWETYIPSESVTQVGRLCKAKHIFYLFDACYSGLAFGRDAVILKSFEKTMLTHRALMALTAGTAEQAVNDTGPEGHSPFTWYVLQGLRGEAARPGTSAITGSDLMLYVRNQVGLYFGSQQTPDFGQLPGHESGGDFVFRVPSITAEIVRGQAYAALEKGNQSQFRRLAAEAAKEDSTSPQARYLRYRVLLLDDRISEAITVLDDLIEASRRAAQPTSLALPLSPWELGDTLRRLLYWAAYLTIPPGALPLQVTLLTGRDEAHLQPAAASWHGDLAAEIVQGDELLCFEFTNPTKEAVHVYWIGIDVDGHLMTERLLDGDALYKGLAPGMTARSRLLHGFADARFFEIRLFASPVLVENLLFPPSHESPPEPPAFPEGRPMTMKRLYVI